MRTASVERITGETKIKLTLNLDGTGLCNVSNPIGFLTTCSKASASTVFLI